MSGESVRQRARKLDIEELLNRFRTVGTDYNCYDEQFSIGELRAELEHRLAESSLARKQEREECAKAVCRHCRDGMERVINVHKGAYYTFPCDAWAIHERGRKVEG